MPAQTSIRTGREEFDSLVPLVRGFLEQDALEVMIDGQRIRGYRSPDARSIWVRDYADMMRGFRHFETDLKSVVTHFADTQAANGRVFDYFTTFPEKLPCERENWTKYVRVPVEADVEYRFVKAAYLAWQATGDDDWLADLLPRLNAALEYAHTHPWRWDREHGMVKRPYTIDTWDFAYTAGGHDWLQFQIDDDTFWGLMHGDGSGYVEAFRLLARMEDVVGKPERATVWSQRAEGLCDALNEFCWNGDFYTHFVKLTPVTIEGVDEANQLSLSNPMAINRGTTTHEMAVAILKEYRRRRETSGAFAEWFSIDPPFPDGIFGDEKLVAGAYVNGGIMPLVGGELARAAFEHGFEEYGVDILRRYHELVSPSGESYLWYFPDGTASTVEASTSPDALPTDGWGSSAMLYALIEGLAGVVDRGKLYETVRLSPRWAAAGVAEADVYVGYAASGAGLGYSYERRPGRIRLTVRGERANVEARVLLPAGTRASGVRVDGHRVQHRTDRIEQSTYACVEFPMSRETEVEIEVFGD